MYMKKTVAIFLMQSNNMLQLSISCLHERLLIAFISGREFFSALLDSCRRSRGVLIYL